MDAKFQYVVGTGGVGKGILFKLLGSHALGKNESRSAELTNSTDFCKLHIILNYVAVLVGDLIPVYAISCVGNDPVGSELLGLMQQSKIHTEYMKVSDGAKTLYSVCYQFPKGEGGNITAVNGANNQVNAQDISRFFRESDCAGRGIILSAPEVPMQARIAILEEGRKRGAFNVASVLSGEIEEFDRLGGFEQTDLLAINEDEAAAVAKFAPVTENCDPLEGCYHYLQKKNPEILLIVTRGKQGSVTYYQGKVQYYPSVAAPVVNTAGAGDCYLGTMIAAMIKGIPVVKPVGSEAEISTAQELATLASSMKVGCSDTIDFSINQKSLSRFAKEHGLRFSKQIKEQFLDGIE